MTGGVVMKITLSNKLEKYLIDKRIGNITVDNIQVKLC